MPAFWFLLALWGDASFHQALAEHKPGSTVRIQAHEPLRKELSYVQDAKNLLSDLHVMLNGAEKVKAPVKSPSLGSSLVDLDTHNERRGSETFLRPSEPGPRPPGLNSVTGGLTQQSAWTKSRLNADDITKAAGRVREEARKILEEAKSTEMALTKLTKENDQYKDYTQQVKEENLKMITALQRGEGSFKIQEKAQSDKLEEVLKDREGQQSTFGNLNSGGILNYNDDSGTENPTDLGNHAEAQRLNSDDHGIVEEHIASDLNA